MTVKRNPWYSQYIKCENVGALKPYKRQASKTK